MLRHSSAVAPVGNVFLSSSFYQALKLNMTFILKEHLLTVLSRMLISPRIFVCDIKQHLLVQKCCFCPQTLARVAPPSAHKSMWKRFHTCSLCSPSFAHRLFRRQRCSKAANWGSFMGTIRRLSCKDDFKSIKLHDGRAAAGVGLIQHLCLFVFPTSFSPLLLRLLFQKAALQQDLITPLLFHQVTHLGRYMDLKNC